MDAPSRPAFRRLDVHRIDDGDRAGVVLIDPLGLCTDQVFVPAALLPVLGRFDGNRSIALLQREVEAMHDGAPSDLVARLVQQLDERLLLASPRFELALQDAVRAFTARGARPARHAGSAGYPSEPARLREALASMVAPAARPVRGAPRGLIAPHIDLARGREGYGQAYGYLAECELADLYVVFGTGHHGPSRIAAGLTMDWETPLGTVPTDREFVQAVHARIGEPPPLDVFLHRDEHSLEFQVLFLRHVLGDRAFRVAGFITGGLPDDPANHDRVRELRDAFAAASEGKRVCYVAGADLAHIGPFFGDPEPISAERLAELASAERARLSHLERGDAGAFHDSVECTGNPDRVCGTTPMYLTAALAGGCAELLYYGRATAPDASQTVSFCAMAFGADDL